MTARWQEMDVLHGVIVHAQESPGKLGRITAPGDDVILLTGQETLDLHPYHGPVVHDRPVLAIDRVRYQGEAVAALAATTPDAAQRAAEALTIRITPMANILTGARPGAAPLVHLTDLLMREDVAGTLPMVGDRGNLLAYLELPGSGNLAHRPGTVELQEPISPAGHYAVTADWQRHPDRLLIETNASDVDGLRSELAAITQLEPEQIELIGHDAGSATASPGAIGIEAIAALLSRRARRPVRLTATAAEFHWPGPRASITFDAAGNAALVIDAGAVAGYLPLWLEPLATTVARYVPLGGILTASLIYSAQPPTAAAFTDWEAAFETALQRVAE